MKKYVLAAAALAAIGSAAEAKCSKASLDGNWIVISDTGSMYQGTINNGSLTAPIFNVPVKVTLGKNCRGLGSMTEGMVTYQVRLAAERISPKSSMKPNLLLLSIQYDAVNGSGFTLFRKG